MADETTQTEEETSWWAFDAFADSELPSTAFDEPLAWPETLDWGDFAAGEGDLQFPSIDDLASDPIFPGSPPPPPAAAPAPPAPTEAIGGSAGDGDATMPHVTVLAALGGSAAPAAPPAQERLPDSLWAAEPAVGTRGGETATGSGTPVIATTMATPTFYAEHDGGAGGWRRRFDLRHGNAAVIALISFASLVLLGMFMSVRARNDVPDTSQTRTTSDQIAVQAPLNTVPLTTTVTTTAPAPINIADLVPAPEGPTPATVGAGGSGGSGSGGGGSTATTAPARSTPTGGGSTATTQPAPQSTATTAAPQATTQPETTSPPTPPADDSTVTTRPRTSIVIPTTPTTPTTATDHTPPTFPGGITIPTIRTGRD